MGGPLGKPKKRAKFNPKDKAYNEVKHILQHKKYEQSKVEEVTVREAYVDAYRSIAFNEVADLKGIMKEKGMSATQGNFLTFLEHNYFNYR